MRKFFITLWEIYRLVVGAAVVVLAVLHFFILTPHRTAPKAAPVSSAPTSSSEADESVSPTRTSGRER
jgi:hypothetical protein